MRGAIWGLIFCNLVFFAWLLLVPREESVVEMRSSDAGGASIVMLDEVRPEQLVPYVAVPNPRLEVEPEQLLGAAYCAELGPFASDGQATDFIVENAGSVALRAVQRSADGAVAYRVYMASRDSASEADALLAELRAAIASNQLGIDSFLIASGDLANGISLGVFGERDNALGVERRLDALGFDVAVREESSQRPQVWVMTDRFESVEAYNQWWLEIAQSNPALQGREKLCETIAQPF